MRVLVAGATGETGRRAVMGLLARGDNVKVLVRSVARARALLDDRVDIHVGDVRVLATLRGMARGMDAVIITTGTRSYFGSNGGAGVDVLGTRNLCAAIAADGRPHVVLLSAFGVERRSPFLSVFSWALNGYFQHKADAEMTLRTSGLPYTIVRPVELRNRPPQGHAILNQVQPLSLLRTVSRDCAADALVACAGLPAALSKTFELAETNAHLPDLVQQVQALARDGVHHAPAYTPLF